MEDVVRELQPLFERTKLYKATLDVWLKKPTSKSLVEAYRNNNNISDEEVYQIAIAELIKFLPNKQKGYTSIRKIVQQFSNDLYGDREHWKMFLPPKN